MGCRDNADIHGEGFLGANRDETLVLQYPQQFGLLVKRQFGNLIEEQCSHIDALEETGVVFDGPVKAPRRCPNNWLSNNVGVSAAQLTAKNG